MTEFNIGGHKLYLSPIMDLFNGEIVACQFEPCTIQNSVLTSPLIFFVQLLKGSSIWQDGAEIVGDVHQRDGSYYTTNKVVAQQDVLAKEISLHDHIHDDWEGKETDKPKK